MKTFGLFRYAIVGLIFGYSFQSTNAEVRLPRLVSDGMVLQRDVPIKIWGWADPSEKVTLLFRNQQFSTVANRLGEWQITLPQQGAGGPYTLSINEKNIKDILLGDVWICSGQSNMELPIKRVLDLYQEEVEGLENSDIRHFVVPKKYDFNKEFLDVESGEWLSVTPQTIMEFSAVAYFFANALQKEYQVPIGLINSSLGGSPAEAWISEEALKRFPHLDQEKVKCQDRNYVDRVIEEERLRGDDWHQLLNRKDEGLIGKHKWSDPNYDDSKWSLMQVPAFWADESLGFTNGSVWFRKCVEIPAGMETAPATIRLGAIVDADSVFINGVFVGSTGYQYPPRNYTIPAGVLNSGKNMIAVRVINQSGRGGFVKDKRYELSVGNYQIDLKGEWRHKLGASMDPLPGTTFFQWKPGGLYNAMIAPLKNYQTKGVLWYQGESNVGRWQTYSDIMKSLITDWRATWGNPKLPFIYVQLANFLEVQKEPSESSWAELREAQRKLLSVSNTGMAVAIDLGEWNDIHPLNKKDLGERLALQARKIAYGDNLVVSSGPTFKSMRKEGNRMVISFENIGIGLDVVQKLKGFAIAGEDNHFVWANAEIQNNEVVVWSDQIAIPKSVRYAWADNPQDANFRNKEGLPASPFTAE